MIIYIDNDYKCHLTNLSGNYKKVETNFFDDKCDEFIEGYRFIPEGETWTREDGITFTGEMISPWKNYNELASAQQSYEHNLLAEYKAELAELDAALLDAQYQILVGGL